MNPITDVNSQYGAPMGRRDKPRGEFYGKVSLRRIRINSGGYDSGGAYWGIGAPLFWACCEDGEYAEFFRAPNRDAAKDHVKLKYPEAKFYR